MHQLLGIAVCVISAGVFIVRYGIPGVGGACGYLSFGILFVAMGVATGKMLEAGTLELLLLERWHLNLSLMAIGYSAVASGLAGLGCSLWRLFENRPPPD